MSLSIPDFPDPQDAAGVVIPGAYAWIAELAIVYSDGRASLNLWVHRSPEAAATWPHDTRIPPAHKMRIACGDPVPGYPDAVFPDLATVMGRAATIAAEMMTSAGDDPSAQSAAIIAIATGGAIRAALYAYLRELVFPGATEVE